MTDFDYVSVARRVRQEYEKRQQRQRLKRQIRAFFQSILRQNPQDPNDGRASWGNPADGRRPFSRVAGPSPLKLPSRARVDKNQRRQ